MGRARHAQEQWAAGSLSSRLSRIREIRGRIADGALALASAVQNGNSSRLEEALSAEVLPLAEGCLFLEREARRILAPRKLGRSGRPLWLGGVDVEIRREPLGLVLIVGPGNYPLFLAGAQALQAIAAGNAVLWKPAPGCTEAAEAFAAIAIQCGVPGGLIQILPEDAAAVEMAVFCGVDKVFLTGSSGTGPRLLATLAPAVVPAVLELSGCDPLLVLDGADPDLVARAIAFGLRFNASRTCIAPRRVFASVGLMSSLEPMVANLALRLPARQVGAATAQRALALTADAVAAGAKIVAGGRLTADGTGFEATVVAGVPLHAKLLEEEIFAPVVALCTVPDMATALHAASRSPYALGAAVFGPRGEALDMAARLPAGFVTINDVIVPSADPRASFGGHGRSGFGVSRGAEGLLEMTRMKTVAIRKRGPWFHFDDPTPADSGLLLNLIQSLHSRGLAARLSAWRRLLGSLCRRWRSQKVSSAS